MNKVTTVNLAGRAFQLEEPAYDVLRSYLDRAEQQLAASPDRAEILHDIEDAIGRHCSATLSVAKDVVTEEEMAGIVEEMGPVVAPDAGDVDANGDVPGGEADADADSTEAPTQVIPDVDAPPRKLFRLTEGAPLGGVCAGLAAFFNIDVTIMRLIWLGAFLFSGGLVAVAYVIMWIAVPEATTPAELHLARQQPQMTAQQMFDRVRTEGAPALAGAGAVILQIIRVIGYIALTVLGIAITVIAIAGVATTWAAWLHGSINGWAFDRGQPEWHLAVFIALVVMAALLVLIAIANIIRGLLAGTTVARQAIAFGALIAGAVLSLILAGILLWSSSADVRQLVRSGDNTNVELHFGRRTICIDDAQVCDVGPLVSTPDSGAVSTPQTAPAAPAAPSQP